MKPEIRVTNEEYVYLRCANQERRDHVWPPYFAPQVHEDEQGRFYQAECPECGSLDTEEIGTTAARAADRTYP